jgi:predicted ferric reductase
MSSVQDVLPRGRNHYFAAKIDSGTGVMGMIMKAQTQKRGSTLFAVLFIGVPVFLYATGNFPRRTLLKESISILTILAFSLMLAQFYLTRTKGRMLSGYLPLKIIKTHKILGYVFVSFLLVHPFLIVVPRYFESGIGSREAFITIITAFDSPGIVIGISGWCLLLILGITSLLRQKLPMSHRTWRLMHGILAVLFAVTASWHAIDLGRHTTSLLSSYVVLAAGCGVFPLLITYLPRSPMRQEVRK